jgi:F-type H+-transporting ATPase subunit a
MLGMHISIAAEKLFSIGPLPVTNSLLVTWITIVIFLVIGIMVRLKVRIVPTGLQNVVEYVLEYFYNMVCDIFESEKKGRKYFPLIMTLFLFVLVINWLGLLPGFGSIGFHRIEEGHEAFVPLFRGASADLNTTLALALVSIGLTQVFSIQSLGFKGFLGRFIKLKSPIMFFVGMLELIAEFAKIISFSFRLFGNIFAGEVLLIVMLTLTKFIVPVPFLFLEVFVGLIQALIFSLLTLFFIKIAITAEEH